MHSVKLIIVSLISGFLFAFLAIPNNAFGLSYPCGSGPGPGERQVGTTGGSNGVASIPICEATGQQQQQGYSPVYTAAPEPEIRIKNFISVASHPKNTDVWATWGQYSVEAAEAVVLDACRKTMGDGCAVVKSGHNISVAIGRAKLGQIYAADGVSAKQAKSGLTALCKSQAQNCKIIRVFNAPERSEPASVTAILREDFDRTGFFKEYSFPANSKVAAPKIGTSDVGAGMNAGLASNLPVVMGIKNIHFSTNGAWVLREGDKKGFGCSVSYMLNDQSVIFFGPTKNNKYGLLMIATNALPFITEARETSAVMTGDQGTANVRVVLMPRGTQEKSLLIMPTDIVKTIAGISDSSPVKIVLDGKPIFDMQIKGGLKARTAMQQCMAQR